MSIDTSKRSSKATRQKNHYKSDGARRENRVEVRFSDYELQALDEVCQRIGEPRSKYLRHCIYEDRYVPVRKEVITRNADLERLCAEVRKAGVNLNQVARALNTQVQYRHYVGYDRISNEEAASKFEKLKEAYDGFKNYLNELYGYWMDERKEKDRYGYH